MKRLTTNPSKRFVSSQPRRICIAASQNGRVYVAADPIDHNNNNNNNNNNRYCRSSSYTLGPSALSKTYNFQYRKFHGSAGVGSPEDNDNNYPLHTVLPFPALSPTMEMGTIAKWEVAEGEEFSAGSILCSVETDKATMDFEAQDDGIVAKILREVGSDATDLPIGTPIAIIVEEREVVAAFADYIVKDDGDGDNDASSTESNTAAAAPKPSSATPVVGGEAGASFLLPSARFLAESKGLDATGLTGTAKGGRVTKGDVLDAIKNGTPMPALVVTGEKAPEFASTTADAAATAAAVAVAPPKIPLEDLPLPDVDTYGTYEDAPNNNMRKIVAKRLTFSKQEVPCTYTSMEVELDSVMKLRKKLFAEHDVKVSVNDIVVRCSALALRDVPEVNGSYDPKTDTVKLSDSVDISIAVAIPNGLITPIVPDTIKLGLSEISDKVRELAGRAREGKLAPEEYSGGTFCISNLGMFGIDEFTAIVNPPQAAILAVGGGVRRIVPTPYVDGADEQMKPTIKTIMTARLSSDRRVVDEATASLFLSAFKHYINKPELLLL